MQEAEIDALSRQALQSVYPDDGSVVFSSAEQERLKHAEELISDTGSSHAADAMGPGCLSGCVNLPDIRVQGATVTLRFMLPVGYPNVSPSLQLIANAPRDHLDQLTQELSTFAEQHAGEEILLLCVDHITATIESRLASGALTAAAPSTTPLPTPDAPQAHTLMHTVVWFHHIQSPKKRRSMAAWSSDLAVGGMYKIGYPGVLMLEGAEADVSEFVARLRGQRWKAMAVRGERREECGSAAALRQRRQLPARLLELQEEQLGDMGDACRAAGLHDLFLCALKLERS